MRKTLVLALAGSIGAVLAAQPRPTFRTDTNAVLLDLRVIDRSGRFVPDLTRDDFRVEEDGIEQSIATFELVNIPLTAPASPPTFAGRTVDRDVASNEHSEGRVYVILLDDLNMHPLRTPTARAIVREFIEHKVSAEDRVLITTTSGRKDIAGDFTSDRERLLAAADRFEAGYGMDRREPQSHSDRAAMSALSGVAKWLSSVDGRRKTIIFVSEGFDSAAPDSWAEWAPGDIYSDFIESTPGAVGRHLSDDASDFGEVVQTAAKSNVTIYGVDPIGLPGGVTNGVKTTPWLDDDQITTASGYNRLTNNRMALAALAEATGGFAAVRTNDFSGAFDRVVSEASSYYLIGYTPTNTKRDGKFRRIRVRTSRQGLGVQARSGYTAPNEKAKPGPIPTGWTKDLVDAIQSPVQIPGLTMRVTAIPFRGTGGDASVEAVVETKSDAVRFQTAGPRALGSVALALAVADANGNIKASHHGDLDMQLQSSTRDAVDQYGVRLLTRLRLKPGHYTMRVASVDSVGETKGSVLYPLDVPDLSKGLAMSGLALATAAESSRPTTGADKEWRAQFELPPTASRVFSPREDLTVLGDIYNNGRSADSLEITTSVKDESGTVVFRQQDIVSGASKYPRRATVPLRDLAPGNYLLSLDATSRSDPKSTASRQVVFAVRP
jgi:VWFA-related protein